MSHPDAGRDGENEAFIVDRYLDSLLARGPTDLAGISPDLRRTAEILATALPRFHPSFRFEEALAARLAATAAGTDTGADPDATLIPFPLPAADRGGRLVVGLRPAQVHPMVLGGVLTSAALSLAGAAYVAWRRSHSPTDPMLRAVRAVARGRIA
jgi:hypothetical protein